MEYTLKTKFDIIKRSVSNKHFLFQRFIFVFHVNLGGEISRIVVFFASKLDSHFDERIFQSGSSTTNQNMIVRVVDRFLQKRWFTEQ